MLLPTWQQICWNDPELPRRMEFTISGYKCWILELDLPGNLTLLKHLKKLRSLLHGAPLVLGTSRKGFIGKITGEEKTDERDFGTVAANVAALCLEQLDNDDVESIQTSGCTILRVHNVKAMKQAVAFMDAWKRTQ
jgi:2-amino-4-hydroxy-6-hydroxymethyldihydropteridine diphosphokinase/dihydropteroate synthase